MVRKILRAAAFTFAMVGLSTAALAATGAVDGDCCCPFCSGGK
jgi:hypothetical protein